MRSANEIYRQKRQIHKSRSPVGAVYEAFAGRQTGAEWPKLKVCDLD